MREKTRSALEAVATLLVVGAILVFTLAAIEFVSEVAPDNAFQGSRR